MSNWLNPHALENGTDPWPDSVCWAKSYRTMKIWKGMGYRNQRHDSKIRCISFDHTKPSNKIWSMVVWGIMASDCNGGKREDSQWFVSRFQLLWHVQVGRWFGNHKKTVLQRSNTKPGFHLACVISARRDFICLAHPHFGGFTSHSSWLQNILSNPLALIPPWVSSKTWRLPGAQSKLQSMRTSKSCSI